MDIPITKPQRKKWVLPTIALLGLVLLYGGYLLAAPDPRVIASSDLAFVVAQKGEMQFLVSGTGSLQARVQKLQTSPSTALVEEILVQAGSQVKAGQVLLRLSAPQLAQQVAQAKAALQKSESDLKEAVLNAQLEEVTLAEASAALVSQLAVETRDLDAKRELASLGIVAKLNLNRQEALVQNLRTQVTNQPAKSAVLRKISQEKMQVKRDNVAQQHEALVLLQKDVAALQVRAPIDGAVQDVFVVLGQSLGVGEKVAQVAASGDLIAGIYVAQNKAAALSAGMRAKLRIQGQLVSAKIVRVDPKVRDGAVQVDIAPDQALPTGARAGQSVSADIEGASAVASIFVEKKPEFVPYDKRDLFVQSGQEKLVRRQIQFGAAAGDVIEVVSGLQSGERIAPSIKQALYKYDALQLKR